MGLKSFVNYDQSPSFCSSLCRQCGIHIALDQEFLRYILQRQEQDQLMQIRKLEGAMRTKMQQELWTKIPDDRMAAQQLIPTDHMTTVDYSRFTSFLEFDDSFLTPWNWKPGNVAGEEGETKPEEPRSSGRNGGPKRYISFEPGSFFAREGC